MYRRAHPICNSPKDIEAFRIYQEADELSAQGPLAPLPTTRPTTRHTTRQTLPSDPSDPSAVFYVLSVHIQPLPSPLLALRAVQPCGV